MFISLDITLSQRWLRRRLERYSVALFALAAIAVLQAETRARVSLFLTAL